MKRVLRIVVVAIFATEGMARATETLYWVIANQATNSCEIVTDQPTVDGQITFQDGPYKSLSDAELARSTISQCPNKSAAGDANDAPASDSK